MTIHRFPGLPAGDAGDQYVEYTDDQLESSIRRYRQQAGTLLGYADEIAKALRTRRRARLDVYLATQGIEIP